MRQVSEKILSQILYELKGLKEEVSNVKQEQQTTNDRLTNVETSIVKVSNQVGTNAENITDIKDNQKTIADVINRMSEVQERQEQTINLLARRSIDQEAELKRIK